MVHLYGNNPTFSFTHNGQTKPVGYLTTSLKGRDWGTENVNDVRRLFGGETVFDSPVFGSEAALVPDEQRAEAASSLMKEVFLFAKSRGMNITLAIDVDTRSANPQNIIMTLPESSRITSTGYGVVNDIAIPDTPEGHAYYRSQIESILSHYPMIDRLAVYFRHSYNSLWKSLKPEKFPPDWKKQYNEILKQYPYLKNDPGTPSIFAIGKIIKAFRKALDEKGRSDIKLAAGSWSYGDMSAAEAIFPEDVDFLPLDYSTVSKMDEKEPKVRWFRKDRKVSSIHLSQNDDGEYIVRPRRPLVNFTSLLKGRDNAGYGILHWTTRFQDVYFRNMADQVWSSSENESLTKTCRRMAEKTFGQKNADIMSRYLYAWSTDAPVFGRVTLDRFIRNPLGNPDNAVAGCRERLKMLSEVDETALDSYSKNLLEYFKRLEKFVIDFHLNQYAFEKSVDYSKKGDFEKAREAIKKCSPESVLEEYAELSALCGVTPGEKGLLISMNLKWLTYFTAQKQLLRLEPVRYNFKQTFHETMAQQPGSKTFHFDVNKNIWKCLGKEETGAETYAVQLNTDSNSSPEEEMSATGIQSEKPLKLSLMTIADEELQNGTYTVHLFFLEPSEEKERGVIFDISLSGSESSLISDRIDISGQPEISKKVLHKTYKLNIDKGLSLIHI